MADSLKEILRLKPNENAFRALRAHVATMHNARDPETMLAAGAADLLLEMYQRLRELDP